MTPHRTALGTQLLSWVWAHGRARSARKVPMAAATTTSTMATNTTGMNTASVGSVEATTARREARSAAAEADEQAAEEQAMAAERAERCDKARARLERYLQSQRLYRMDENGERVYLDDAQRETARQKAEEQITEYCS